LFIPAGTIHSARNVGSNRAAELGTYIVEKGKPLVTLVQSANVSKKETWKYDHLVNSIYFRH
jgi:hypothetical protein